MAAVLLPSTESGPVLDSAASVTSNSVGGYYIAPYVAALDTSGNATLTAEQLQQLSVTIANIQRTFKVKLDLTQTTAFLNSFTVSKNGANLKVELDKAAFGAVLDAVINDAKDEASLAIPADPANGIKGRLAKPEATIKEWLEHGLKNTLVDYILRTLKVSATVATAPVTVNAVEPPAIVGKATLSMADGLAPPAATDSNTLEAIYLQIAQSTLELYRTDNIPTTNALPLKGGDKMVFVFDTNPLTVTTAVTQTQSNASGAAVNPLGGQIVTDPLLVPKGPIDPATGLPDVYAQGNPGAIVMTDTYRVAFEVQMADASVAAPAGAFDLALVGDVNATSFASPTAANVLRRVDKKWWNYA
jgi:hypothetical protein